MSDAGTVVGYFFALLVVICFLPLILLILRYFRLKKKDIFELKLERNAIIYMIENRELLIQKNLEEQRNSFKYKSKQLINENISVLNSSLLLSENDTHHFTELLRQQHTFWGIKDIFLNEGKLKFTETFSILIPIGLFEDFIFYICNNVNPIAFLFASKSHPQSMISRFVSYTTAQTFVLLLYFLINDSTLRTIISTLLSPFIILVEHWLNLMLICPCLPENEEINNNNNNNNDDDVNSSTNETKIDNPPNNSNPNNNPPNNNNNNNKQLYKGCYGFLRLTGWFLAFPILFYLIIFLVLIAIEISRKNIPPYSVGRFVVDGIIIPFFIKVSLSALDYLWFIHPTHITICGATVLTINSWSESQSNEYLLTKSVSLTETEQRNQLKLREKANYSDVDLCHMSCHCLQCTGYHLDTHYSFNICLPSCYFTRCCDGLSAWYWEEDEAVEELLPSPIRHLSFSQNSTSTSPTTTTKTIDNNSTVQIEL